jgi:hypothetical protein
VDGQAVLRAGGPAPLVPEGKTPGWPLEGVVVPPGNIICISGEPGSGKTTLVYQFGPNVADSTEQVIAVMAARYRQVNKSPGQSIHLRAGRDPLPPPPGDGTWSQDSVSNLSDGENWYKETFFDWVHCSGAFKRDLGRKRWGIAVLQATKAGEYRGTAEVPHLADICVHLAEDDDLGLHMAERWKDRYNPEGRTYYELGETITKPEFSGIFGVKNDSPGFKFIPDWSRSSSWFPDDLVNPGCKAVASIPEGRTPQWSRRKRDSVVPSPAERFCHIHDVCYRSSLGVWHHHHSCELSHVGQQGELVT